MFNKKLDARDRLIRARIELQREKPFFSFLVMHLKFIEAKKEDCPTMGVNADGDLFYNPEFVDTLDATNCKSVLCHEVMHCALEHLLRLDNRNPQVWNVVNDAKINDMIVKEGMQLPGDCIIPRNDAIKLFGIDIKKVDDKSSEEIYDEVYKNIKRKQDKANKSIRDFINKHPDLKKGFDKHIYGKQGNKNNKKMKEDAKNWKKILIDACTHAKQQGHLPAGMERIVGRLLETHIDWKGLLYRYITNEIPIDYTWSRPSRKSFSTGIYLPDTEKEKIDIIVAIDTSGSISQHELQMFMSEVVSILRQYRHVDLTIIDCDAEINSAITYKNATINDALRFNLKGGGGTSHLPVFKWIDKNLPTAKLLLAFTDGYTSFPKEENVNINTIWIVAGSYRLPSKDFPFGNVIELPMNE